MIKTQKGNLLYAEAEVLVNPVNCEGVMGKGLALRFKRWFPDMFKEYCYACETGELGLGKMHIYTRIQINPGEIRYIFNFPTKLYWRDKSRIEDIKTGLVDLVACVQDFEVHSIAIPALGCGEGGLDWAEVRPLIVQAFEELPDVEVLLFEPL